MSLRLAISIQPPVSSTRASAQKIMSLDGKAWTFLIALAAVEITISTAAAVCPEHLQFLGAKGAQWQSYVLPVAPPPSRGNALADNEPAAALGFKIFFDNRFSQSGSGAACVSCHDPEHAF